MKSILRRSLLLCLAIILFICALPIPGAFAVTTDEIKTQVSNTYRTACQKAGVSSFNGYCAWLVNWELSILGINSSYVGGNGNDEFDNYKNLEKSNGGYYIAAYPAANYNLKNALNEITNNGTQNAFNILVGFEKGSGSDGALYGHTVFIHAIIDGTVYFCESFNTYIGGISYTEGSVIACSISTFSSYYDSWTTLDGVIHFQKEKGYLSKCTPYPSYGTITITNSCNPYTLPCNSDTAKKYGCISTALTAKALKPGDKVEVIGIVMNSEGNYWYKVVLSDGTTAWVYSKQAGVMTHKDPYISGSILPDTISGAVALSGSVVTGGCQLNSVWGVVYTSSAKEVLTSSKASTSTVSSFTLGGSVVDKTLTFESLKSYGNATYKLYIFGNATSYSLDSNYKLQTYTRDFEAGNKIFNFTVSSGSGGASTGTYAITLQANGGSCSTSAISVKAGNAIGSLPTPNFDQMNFEGWYTEPFGGTQIAPNTVPTGNMTIWAHYSYPVSSVKLNFDPNGGTLPGAVLSATIDGINRGRPGETLVVFNQSGSKPGTNIYGKEIAVNSMGKITAIREYGNETQLTVPSGGFILSGQQGWDASAGVHVGGAMFVKQILAMDEAYVSLNYETGEVKVFDSYAGYLNETKRGMEYTTYGVLPVPVREGYVFKGWMDDQGHLVNYFSGFSGINLTACWDKEEYLSHKAAIEYNGHYYELFDHNVSWTEAQRICKSRGGYLVVITTATEQAQIVALTEEGTRGAYRIGATDAGSEGGWNWVNGETFSYSGWDKSLPEPSAKDGEDYANIIAIENAPNKQVGEWVDDYDVFYGNFYDLSNTGFICEYDKKPGCSHKYTDIVTAPTCTNQGYTTYICSVCGNSYTGNTTPATGHTEVTDAAVAVTCTKDGLTEGKHCDLCGTVTVAQQTVKATGHKEVTDKAVAATCTTDGRTEGKHCSVCGTVTVAQQTIKASGHSFANGKCSACGEADPDYVAPTEPKPTEPDVTEPKPTEPEVQGVTRIAGGDRYQTSFKSADQLKAVLGVSKFQNIVVASGTDFPDALAGSYLAAQKDAPILLVRAKNVNDVKDYIKKNLNPGGTVYLLGGKNAVPTAMETGLDGFTVKRLGGATRYDTNLQILKEAGVEGKDIIVCTGLNFADSLSASACGLPILLVKDGLYASQKEFLKTVSGDFIIVGGTNAVNATVEKQLKGYGTVKRLAGNTRYDTSVLVAKEFFNAPTSALLAYAQNFPDGLCGGPLAYNLNAPLILTDNNKPKAAVTYTTGLAIKSGYVLGGTGLISDKVVKQVFSMTAADVILIK